MHPGFLDLLACPRTGESLVLSDEQMDGELIVSGTLRAKESGHEYPIIDGIARLLPSPETGGKTRKSFGLQWEQKARGPPMSGCAAKHPGLVRFRPVAGVRPMGGRDQSRPRGFRSVMEDSLSAAAWEALEGWDRVSGAVHGHRVSYAGISRIRFEGLLSACGRHP